MARQKVAAEIGRALAVLEYLQGSYFAPGEFVDATLMNRAGYLSQVIISWT